MYSSNSAALGFDLYILGMYMKHSEDWLHKTLIVTGQRGSSLTDFYLLTW